MKNAVQNLVAFGLVLFLVSQSLAEGYRTWTDKSGIYQTEAVLVDVTDGVVTLKNKHGRTIRVAIEKLSAADQQFVRNQADKASKDQGHLPAATHRPESPLKTPIGTLISAHFSDNVDLYFYDAGSTLPGIRTRAKSLVVVFQTSEMTFGPWAASDYVVIDAEGKRHPASMIDVGGNGYWCSIRGGQPATSIESLKRTAGDASICYLQFAGVSNPRVGEITVEYKDQRARLTKMP